MAVGLPRPVKDPCSKSARPGEWVKLPDGGPAAPAAPGADVGELRRAAIRRRIRRARRQRSSIRAAETWAAAAGAARRRRPRHDRRHRPRRRASHPRLRSAAVELRRVRDRATGVAVGQGDPCARGGRAVATHVPCRRVRRAAAAGVGRVRAHARRPPRGVRRRRRAGHAIAKLAADVGGGRAVRPLSPGVRLDGQQAAGVGRRRGLAGTRADAVPRRRRLRSGARRVDADVGRGRAAAALEAGGGLDGQVHGAGRRRRLADHRRRARARTTPTSTIRRPIAGRLSRARRSSPRRTGSAPSSTRSGRVLFFDTHQPEIVRRARSARAPIRRSHAARDAARALRASAFRLDGRARCWCGAATGRLPGYVNPCDNFRGPGGCDPPSPPFAVFADGWVFAPP